MTTIADRIEMVRQRLAAAGGADVTLVAVAKTYPFSAVAEAVAAGVPDIGESYAQEFVAKYDDGGTAAEQIRWHFVGGLQRNKVRRLAGRVSLWQSLDRAPLVDEVAKRDPGAAVLIQVNSTGEEQKSGCAPDDTEALVERARAAGLVVEGLMTIGHVDDVSRTASGFRLVRAQVDALGLRHCSMGMSADLETAVGEGSTMVRVGRDVFGPRHDGGRIGPGAESL